MSGVEIIGLILGGLPLAISAIEHYRDGLDPLKDYLRYGSTLKSLRTRLRIQQDLFEGTLRRLLQENLSESQARQLFPDPGNAVDQSLWGTEMIDDMLHQRLGKKYTNFMDVVREMEGVMRQMIEKLDVDIDDKGSDVLPKWNDNALATSKTAIKRGEWEWRKIKRSFGRKDREALMQQFERYNWDIARYVEQWEILAPPSKNKPDELSRYYHMVRSRACGLYDVLEDGWKCHCRFSHNANLQLEQRTDTHIVPEFKMYLSFLPRSSHEEPGLRVWLEAQVDVDELEGELASSNDRHDLDLDLNRKTSSLDPVLPLSKTLQSETISMPPNTETLTYYSVKVIEPANQNKRMPEVSGVQSTICDISPPQSAPHILSLCEAIQGVQTPNTDLGTLANMATKRCIRIRNTAILNSADTAEPISLASLLPSSKIPLQRSRSTKLSRHQRLSIAVTLAHGVLQLHKSPWLNEAWSKSDIFFFSHGTDAFKRPTIGRPYVSRSFKPISNGPGPTQSSSARSDDIFKDQIINKTLFALGIVLIELCFNRSFDDLCAESRDPHLPAPEDIAPPDTIEIYRVATSLIDDVYNEQGTQYGYVVQRCLRCEFGIQDSQKQLEFDAFRALVYEGVLAPLEEDLKRYTL